MEMNGVTVNHLGEVIVREKVVAHLTLHGALGLSLLLLKYANGKLDPHYIPPKTETKDESRPHDNEHREPAEASGAS